MHEEAGETVLERAQVARSRGDLSEGGVVDAVSASRAAPEGSFDAVARVLCEALDLWSADLWTLSPDGDSLVCRGFWSRQHGDPARGCVGAVVPLARSGDLRRIVLAGETIERHDDDGGSSPADSAALRAQGLASRMDVPLRVRDEVLGVLCLGERRGVRRLDAAEREVLRRFCELAAVAAREDARAAAGEARCRRLVDLVHSGRSMVASLHVRTTVAFATAQVSGLFAGTDCSVELPLSREDGSFARVVPGLGDEAEFGAACEAWPADALARQAVSKRRRETERTGDGRSRLLLPVVHEAHVLGYLDVRVHMTRAFREHEVELVQLVADQAATALAAARTRRALEQRVATDAQTGLYGRWYFYERLAAEVARARRYSQPLSLLVAQIDDLDRVAGTRGHVAAERALQALARIVRSCLRSKVDVPCRHGAESFAVLLPATPAIDGGAGLVAARVREVTEATQVSDDELGDLGRFTLSVGVAGFPQHGDDAEELAALAEEAAGLARRRGGNQVAFAGRR